mgnify:FL=1
MSKRVKAFKYVLMIVVILVIIGLIVYLFPVVRNLSTPEGKIEFKNQVSSMGILGYLALFGLQFAQIFLIIIPGEPIEVLAGMCYGGIGGTIFITVSVFIITTIIFFTVRKLGRRFVYSFCSKEKIEKIENSKLFKNEKKIEWIMLILFLIPGTPKDLLVYIGGLLQLKPLKFILISTFARLPSVVSSTFAGSSIAGGNWKFSIIIYAVTFILVGLFIFIANKFDKDKTAEEAMKIMK